MLRRPFPRVLFAVKAFTSHAMIRLALDEGLDLLCASGGEVEACLRAGAAGGRIVLHGSNKSDAELELAAVSGLSLVIADGREELDRIDRAARGRGVVQPVLLRVVPEVEVQTHEAIATGHEASKFGTPIADVVTVARIAQGLPGVRFEGLHAHVGSQVLDTIPYRRTLDVLVELAAALRDEASIEVSVLDIGGGFGVTYTDERPLNLTEVAATIEDGWLVTITVLYQDVRVDFSQPTSTIHTRRVSSAPKRPVCKRPPTSTSPSATKATTDGTT